jgi:SpoVK/Ycf46/Vps4 family AAA+-type ATPase
MGPPGNGKTAVCRAIATSTEVPIIYCSLSDAEPHIILASLPRTIRNNAPCILMIEDVDAMADTVSMRAGFLNILDGLTGEAGLLTIASTNSPEKLDPAFSARPSRFDELYHFKDPTEEMRKAILFRKLGKNFSEKELSKVAKQTSGLSAAFVQEIAIKALRSSFLKGKPITIKDLVAATERVKGHIADSSVEWTGRIGFS